MVVATSRVTLLGERGPALSVRCGDRAVLLRVSLLPAFNRFPLPVRGSAAGRTRCSRAYRRAVVLHLLQPSPSHASQAIPATQLGGQRSGSVPSRSGKATPIERIVSRTDQFAFGSQRANQAGFLGHRSQLGAVASAIAIPERKRKGRITQAELRAKHLQRTGKSWRSSSGRLWKSA